jgi:hypothetical protein
MVRTARLLVPIFGVAWLFAADLKTEAERWWAHVAFLADDKLEGRNTGSEGYRIAARYVAAEFERNGIAPAGTKGYYQPMNLRALQIDDEKSSLELVRGGKAEKLSFVEDVNFNLRAGLAPFVEAAAVFVGHGLVIPEANIDDLAGLDLKGKIAVFLTGAPRHVPSALQAHYSSAGERWKAFRAAGAAGQLSIANPKSMDIPWERATLARLNPSMVLTDEKLFETPGLRFSASFNPARADKLFAGTGYSFAEILQLADASQPLPKFPLPGALRARPVVRRSELESMNVVGRIEGSDARLKQEHVVLSAHLDHVGVGQPINGDRIYNGAMDNATGIASLLETARLARERGLKPKRSLVFLAVTAEEKGLQGSKYFAHYPTVAKDGIVANINMDMFLPLFPLKYLEVQGLDESTLGDVIRAVAQRHGVEAIADQEPARNRFIRSDQYSFIRQGVPALAFKFGFAPGSPEQQTMKDWLRERYHAPSDDLTQPVDKEGAARFNRILVDLLAEIANAPDRPRWKDGSFFKRFAR